jgi:hypothetical protein
MMRINSIHSSKGTGREIVILINFDKYNLEKISSSDI